MFWKQIITADVNYSITAFEYCCGQWRPLELKRLRITVLEDWTKFAFLSNQICAWCMKQLSKNPLDVHRKGGLHISRDGNIIETWGGLFCPGTVSNHPQPCPVLTLLFLLAPGGHQLCCVEQTGAAHPGLGQPQRKSFSLGSEKEWLDHQSQRPQ